MAVVHEPNPTAARRELALFFRALREQRELSIEELAAYLGVSEAQASRLDKGDRGLRTEDVDKLIKLYEVPTTERDRLLALAIESRKRGWWQQVELPSAYRTLIGMEQAARSINEYCTSVIPGLLQTREYALAAATASTVGLRREQIMQAVDVRMRRQQILERNPAPDFWAVVDEAALRRGAGGPPVMRAQLEHLMAATEQPGIKVQIIPFDYGVHPGINSHFILLDTDGALPDLVYVEGLWGRSESASGDDVRRYRRIWDSLRALALSFPESRSLMEQHLNKLPPS